MKNLKEFDKTTSFQKTIASILINLIGDKEEIANLKQAFEDIDKNNDGKIDYSDLNNLDVDTKWRDILTSINLTASS